MDRNRVGVEGGLARVQHILEHASRPWQRALLDLKQALQTAYFPDGVVYTKRSGTGRVITGLTLSRSSYFRLPKGRASELLNVLVLKAKKPATSARTAILTWRDAYPLSETSATVMVNAVDLAADRNLRTWDSVILSATAEAGCRLLHQKISRRASRGRA
jgi:hypothetical protein